MFHDMKLGTRLTAGFGAILLLLVGMATVSIDRVNFIDQSLTTMNDVNSVKQRYAINFRGSVHDRAISLRDVVLVGPSSELDAALADIDRLTANYDASAEKLGAIFAAGTGVTADERQILAGIQEIEAKTLPLIKEVVARRQRADAVGAHALLMGEARPAFTEWLKRINQFIDLQEASNKAIATDARAVAEGFQILTLLLCLGALAVGLAIGTWALRSIKPLRHLTEIMGRLAKGDNAVEVPYATRGDEVGAIAKAVRVFQEGGIERLRLERDATKFRDDLDTKLAETETAFTAAGRAQKEIVDALAAQLLKLADGDLTARLAGSVAPEYAQLQSDFNTAVTRLEEAMGSIAGATGRIAGGSQELATASDDLSRRTEQQAAGLEETAAALNEITSTVRRTASDAQQASKAVKTARSDAEKSGQVVDEAVAAMGQIEASSDKISKIIGVIDEIAFQTNLLALNAGVEAARAGEAGRGFAVVAQEVRGLAQRSAEAAKEIKELISASSAQVGQGVDLVGRTGEALRRIVDQIASINDLVAGIDQSAGEQAVSLAEVNTAISHMDQVVQQNAAMVEEATAATHSMKGDAEDLTSLIAQFRTAAPAQQSRRRAAPAAQKPRMVSHNAPAPRAAARGAGAGAAAARKPDAAPQGDDWAEF